jgi:short-subunit dehydrogenase
VVTGGGNGIGRQLVLELARLGAQVAAVDIDQKGLKETVQLAVVPGCKLSTHVVDITNRKAVEGLLEQVIKIHGAVDGIINNAGIIQPFERLNELTYAQIDKVLGVNFNGMLYMTKTFLPYLLKRPQGHIVNVSSMGGFLPVPGQTLYGASKAAVKLLTEGLYSELLGTSVRVSIVFPGAIGTNIAVNSGVASAEKAASMSTGKMRVTDPKIAARQIVKGIEKDQYRILVGSDAKMMDFLTRLAPKGAAKFIYNQMKSLLPA